MSKPISVMNNLHRISDKIAESSHHIHDPAPAPAAQEPPAESSVPAVHQPPSELLQRRYQDFSRGRRDLLERLASMESRLAAEAASAEARLAVVRGTLEQIRKIASELPEDDPDRMAFSDRSELAEKCLALEKLRLETIRLAPAVESAASSASDSASGSAERSSILMDSLTFRQVFRIAWFASLPVMIALAVAALVLMISIIGAFKGWF